MGRKEEQGLLAGAVTFEGFAEEEGEREDLGIWI
jgi:hypothetical protein